MELGLYNQVVQAWYQWGQFVALAVTLLALFWVFYDAERHGNGALPWKVLSAVGVFLVLPSLIIWGVPDLSMGRLAPAVEPFAYVGLGGVVLALLALVLHLTGVGTRSGTVACPSCGQSLHPSWDYCPYCAERESRAEIPPGQPPSSPPKVSRTVPAEPVAPPPLEQRPRMTETELLKPELPDELAWVVLLSGTHAGKEFRLGETTTIGRHPGQNDIVLDDSAVSRHHVKIRSEDGAFTLHDLASTDGTYLHIEGSDEEWVEIHKHRLEDGDRIRVGRVVLGFMQITNEE